MGTRFAVLSSGLHLQVIDETQLESDDLVLCDLDKFMQPLVVSQYLLVEMHLMIDVCPYWHMALIYIYSNYKGTTTSS